MSKPLKSSVCVAAFTPVKTTNAEQQQSRSRLFAFCEQTRLSILKKTAKIALSAAP